MKNAITTLALCATMATTAAAQQYDQHFTDSTLRLDYTFSGNEKEQHIYLHDMKKQARWAGRKSRLTEIPLAGNGQVIVQDHETHDTLYVHTFSTLFQEWVCEEEAQRVSRSFETSYNVPMPRRKADITIRLTDTHRRVSAQLTHTVDPTDILIRPVGANGIPYHYVWRGAGTVGDSVNVTDCIDLAILAEGYTEGEMGKFYADCQRAVDALFEREPFRSLKPRFNVVAVAPPSLESGPSIPNKGVWRTTAMSSNYDTFYSARYLTSSRMHRIYDMLSGVPFEHIIVMVNSSTYGGGGIYNQLMLTTSDHSTFNEVLVHEFGHSYAGLGDEYAYTHSVNPHYPADTEPWEPNLTTLYDFASKWQDMMPKGQPIPTPLDPKVPDYRKIKKGDTKALDALNRATQVVGVFEGAGYQLKGCYRPAQECRMKINQVRDFCPVCTRAILRITDFYTAK